MFECASDDVDCGLGQGMLRVAGLSRASYCEVEIRSNQIHSHHGVTESQNTETAARSVAQRGPGPHKLGTRDSQFILTRTAALPPDQASRLAAPGPSRSPRRPATGRRSRAAP